MLATVPGHQVFQLVLSTFFLGLFLGWQAYLGAVAAGCMLLAVGLDVAHDRRSASRTARRAARLSSRP
jgi:hypothetical protein